MNATSQYGTLVTKDGVQQLSSTETKANYYFDIYVKFI